MSPMAARKSRIRIPTERQRLVDDRAGKENWRRWGPYLSERQWGTVREEYSAWGGAGDYLPHDRARSRACRWGEAGIAGFSDDRQYLYLSLALWNGEEPILEERLFGLTNSEGNHGEDVKELYHYLDATPSHSTLKMLPGESRSGVFGSNSNWLAGDPHFRDYVLFHEYFHGDTGRGVGASHQTGWTGFVAKLLQPHTTERSTLRDTVVGAAQSAVSKRRRVAP
jgi:hypothetical protein